MDITNTAVMEIWKMEYGKWYRTRIRDMGIVGIHGIGRGNRMALVATYSSVFYTMD